jgi:hypothetical protein
VTDTLDEIGLRDTKGRFDWAKVITPGLVILGFATQWGNQAQQMAELNRRVESLEKTIQERMMTRNEIEERDREFDRRLRVIERVMEDRRIGKP